jgi:hypothetical protein
MPTSTIEVKLDAKVLLITKTWRDYQWEKMRALQEICKDSQYSENEKIIAKSLARTIRVSLEKGYK